jgi:hypothetical protein
MDNTAPLWDAAAGKPPAVLEGQTAPVLSAAFSPDGTRSSPPRRTTRRSWRPRGDRYRHEVAGSFELWHQHLN